MAGGPFDGQALLVAAAKASVPGERLPDLVDLAQTRLGERLETYRQRYELAYEDDSQAAFFVEAGHWEDLGGEFGFDERDWKALRRVHGEQLRLLGRETGRRDEFETALDIREAVVIGTDRD